MPFFSYNYMEKLAVEFYICHNKKWDIKQRAILKIYMKMISEKISREDKRRGKSEIAVRL